MPEMIPLTITSDESLITTSRKTTTTTTTTKKNKNKTNEQMYTYVVCIN